MIGWGGKRPGAGRPKGVRDRTPRLRIRCPLSAADVAFAEAAAAHLVADEPLSSADRRRLARVIDRILAAWRESPNATAPELFDGA